MVRTKLLILSLGLALVAAAPAFAFGAAPWYDYGATTHTYVGPGTIVTNFDLATFSLTIADNGAVVCRDADGDGVYESGSGGSCVSFAELGRKGNAIYVHDEAVPDDQLAFQVCIDLNGDGVCGGPSVGGDATGFDPCSDRIFYSHSGRNGGENHNPLTLPREWIENWMWSSATGYGCGQNGGFPGYVVIVCAGVHDAGSEHSHAHEATRGRIQPVHSTAPFHDGGDYCGGPVAAKAYELQG